VVSRLFRAFDSIVGPVNNGCLPREEDCQPEKQETFSSYPPTQTPSAKAESTFQNTSIDFDLHQSPFPYYYNKGTNRNVSSPLVVPITALEMNITTEQSPIGCKELSIWTTIEVGANISAERWAKIQMPLDTVILLDNAYVVFALKTTNFICLRRSHFRHGSPASTLRQMANSACIIASTLNDRIDRFAIGYVHESGGLQVLVPLASHSLDLTKVIESLLLSVLTKDSRDGFGLDKAIFQAVDMLVQHGNATLCHVFVITGNCNRTTFSLPMIDARVGLHTISLDPQFRLYGSEAPYGWHVYPENDLAIAEGTLRDKIQMVIAHLHTGVNSGTAKDLRLSLVPGDGCQIESIYGNTFCKDLRPGEKWTISAKIRVPATSVRQFDMPHRNQTEAEIRVGNQCHTVEDLMAQLQHMLDTRPPETEQIFMTVFLGYRHSLLPKSHAIRVSECCSVARSLRRDSGCVVDSLEDFQEHRPAVDSSIFRLRNITESPDLTDNNQIPRKPSPLQISNGDGLDKTCGGKSSFMERLLHVDNNQVSTTTEKRPDIVMRGVFDDSSDLRNREHELYGIDLTDDSLGDVRSSASICSFENAKPKTGNRTWESHWLLE
jgi:hypothetical protein